MIVRPKRCDEALYRARDKARPFLCLHTAIGCSSRTLSICFILYGNNPFSKVIVSTVSSVQGLNRSSIVVLGLLPLVFQSAGSCRFLAMGNYLIFTGLLFVILVIDSNRAIKNTLCLMSLKIEACTSNSFPILLRSYTIQPLNALFLSLPEPWQYSVNRLYVPEDPQKLSLVNIYSDMVDPSRLR